ncbi:hypothetical protein QFC22_003002 [Naganishia vaughanmartiniae]|uniref:Uncharacterized protein n=1 Tax=Naganishia vaughanmartiniae TaxID=1424756 RepID=A0ACC2X9S1_9TREE|nr:hypothetical protein QFC22_003002 [Naganishia vaughanmartiniae]
MTSSSVPIPSIPTVHGAANAIAVHVRDAAHSMTQDSTNKAELGRPPSHTGLQEEGDGGATIGPSVEERQRQREHYPAGGTRKVRTVPPFAAFDPPSPVMSPRILPADDDVPRTNQSTSPIPAQAQPHTHRHKHYPHLSLSSDLTRTLSSDELQGGADQPPPWWTFAKPGRWKQVQTLHNAWVEQMLANEELRKESEHLGRDYFASKRGSAVGSTIGLGGGEEAQPVGRQGETEMNELGPTNPGETPLRHPHIHALRPPFAMSGLQPSRGGGSYFHLGKLRRRSVSQEDLDNPESSSSPSPFHFPSGAATGGAGTPQTQFHTPAQTPMPLGSGTPASATGTAAPMQQKGRHRARFKAMSLPVSRRQSTDNTRVGTPIKTSAPLLPSTVGGVYQPPNTGEPETSEDSSAVGNAHKSTGHQVTGFVLGPPLEHSSGLTMPPGDGLLTEGPPQSSSAVWSVRAVDGEQQGGGVGSNTSVPCTPPSRLLPLQPTAPSTQLGESRPSSQNITDSPVQLTTSLDTASSSKKASQESQSVAMSSHRKGHHPNFSITLPPPAFAPPITTETTRLSGTTTGGRTDIAVPPPPPPPPMFPQPHRHQAQAPPTPLGWDAPWRERDLVGRRFERASRAGEAGRAVTGKRDSGYGVNGAAAVPDPWLQPFEETAFDAEDGEDGCSVGSLAGGRGWKPSEDRGAGRGGSESSGGPLTAGMMGMSEKNPAGRQRSSKGRKSRGGTRAGKNSSGNQGGKMSKWVMLRHSAVKNPTGSRRAKLRKYFIFDARSTLYLRLATLVGIATSLGLGAKLFSLENASDLDGILGSAPILSISYGSVSAIHCLVVMYREAFGKPIGLWGLRSKMTWVCLDLFFIALWSSCLSLTISDYMSSPLQCSSLNPWWTTGTYTITLPEVITKSHQKEKMCERQAALIGFVLFTLIMYVINMVISLFRIFERLSTVAKSYEKSRVGQLV